jgi:hypothetical protein
MGTRDPPVLAGVRIPEVISAYNPPERLSHNGSSSARSLLLAGVLLDGWEGWKPQLHLPHAGKSLSGFATIAVVMAGGALLGVIGAILAVPVAASLKVVLRELTAARRERMAALRAQPAEPGGAPG